MNPEPRYEGDYTDRQVAAARRVLVDAGQVLASFHDAVVVVGGWVPDLLLRNSKSEHIGSVDVDLALDAAKLGDGRYAELLKLLLDTGRYEKGEKDFQLVTTVDLNDGEVPVRVEVDFLSSLRPLCAPPSISMRFCASCLIVSQPPRPFAASECGSRLAALS